jgi:primase-polymerase (primpol)-like protein
VNARPARTLVDAHAIPADLKQFPQWVAWRRELRQDKWTKVPVDARTGRNGSSVDPTTWATFDVALAAYQAQPDYDGIGLVVTADLGLVGVDLDHISDHADDAAGIIDTLNSYTETTPSGRRGAHLRVGRVACKAQAARVG